MLGLTIAVFCFLATGPSCTGSDNFALLSGTLKTMQQAACDDEMVALACPRGTSISIQVAQNGRAASEGHSCIADTTQVNTDADVAAEDCLWPNTMQYSLLQTVVEACQRKPQCEFSTKLKPGLKDPCPHTRKYVEVAYKCRPKEFRSLTGCEGDVIKLSCNPYSRVAVFDAQYGRQAYETITCPQTQGVDETCKAQFATETVMHMCHGKRRCAFTANNRTFGSPCKPASRPYIKVIYACVPLGVLTERYESAREQDEGVGHKDYDNNESGFDDSDGAGEKWEYNAILPIADPALLPLPDDEVATEGGEVTETTVTHPVQDKEVVPEYAKARTRLFIYIGIGVLIFVILTLLLIAVRCYIIRRSSRTSKTGDMFSTEAPNVFNDAVSDIDNDIDVSHISGTFYDPVHPDMILYRDVPGSKGTLRAMRPLSTIYPCAGASMYGNVDYVPPREGTFKDEPRSTELMSPKSLKSYPNSQFYYG